MKKNIVLCITGLVAGICALIFNLPTLFSASLAVVSVVLMVYSVRNKITRTVKKETDIKSFVG